MSGRKKSDNSSLEDKQVFTTGEAADLCKVSQQTIIRCFDSGRLKGFRVPGSRFRRIPREELIRFMRDNGIPTTELETQRKRVLIVDDDEQIVRLFVDVLSNDPRYEVSSASSGYEAGIQTEQFRPDLIVLDYMLPDVNGNVVCESIRKNPNFANTRIIFVSGVVKQEEIESLLQAGADEFIKKPFDIEAIMSLIGELVGIDNQ